MPEDTLQALFAYAGVTAFPKNAVIINEGDQTSLVYLIRSGRVKVAMRLMGLPLAAKAVEIFAGGIVVLLPGLR